MRIPYKGDMPEVKIKVKGLTGEIQYDAYLDTGAFKCLIPETDATKIGLLPAGATEIITGSGKDHIKLYKATITFLNKEFSVLVLGKDLPEQAVVKAIVGRDILDEYRACFDGIKKEIEIT
jgi:predicted aspartyl protease